MDVSAASSCLPSSEGRALNAGCFLRYSDTYFLNYPEPGNGDSRAVGTAGRKRVIVVSAGCVAAVLIIGALFGVFIRNKGAIRKEREGCVTVVSFTDASKIMSICFRGECVKGKSKAENDTDIELFLKNNKNLAPKRFRYSDLKKITNSFTDRLGKGGFCSVYKGKIHDGRLVAVKILNESKGSGEEFVNEVASISRTSHINIVNLLGFCFEGPKRALIYEFMPNGSLEKFLYKNSAGKG